MNCDSALPGWSVRTGIVLIDEVGVVAVNGTLARLLINAAESESTVARARYWSAEGETFGVGEARSDIAVQGPARLIVVDGQVEQTQEFAMTVVT